MTAELKPITGMRESVEDLSGTVTEYSYVTPTEETMRELTRLLFEEHWHEIIVGPCIEGAVFEIRFEQASWPSSKQRTIAVSAAAAATACGCGMGSASR